MKHNNVTIVVTESGARYTVIADKITRRCAADIIGRPEGVDHEPLVDAVSPWPGRPWRFKIEPGWVTTSRVVKVIAR